MDIILSYIGSLVVLTVASLPLTIGTLAIVYPFLMKAISFTVGKQVEHLFAVRIEQLRASHLLSNTFISEAAKREADYVIETWGLLRIAYIETADVISPFRSYEDLDKIPSDELSVSMEIHGLTQPQISAVLASSNKQYTFQRYYDAHRHATAHDAAVSFNHHFAKHRIFMSQDIVDLFKQAAEPMWDALKANDQNNSFPSKRSREEWERRTAFAKEYPALLQPVEDRLKAKFIVMMKGYAASGHEVV